MPTYEPALLDEIRAGVDIVDLVGRFVTLKKAGSGWKGLCPFHAEKTPSFTVNPQKGIFHCFGCGVGGDAFGFVMRQDRLSFPEAVRALARTAGVTLPDAAAREPGESGREELLRVMDLASRFYTEILWGPRGERARRYLDERGIQPDVARRFALGYAPESWDALIGALRREGVTDDTLVAAGLAVARDGGGIYDRFRGRLLFAVRDLAGRVVAFGGRAFGDEQPKYLNSPETPLYTKGALLYAADLARETMRTRNRALVVEGYVDCVIAHQHGFTETVAALGTAFTPAQLQLLRRSCDEAVLFFDADAAGQKAAERAEALLEPTGVGDAWGVNRAGAFGGSGTMRLRVALLPAGHDPDTFLRAEGAVALEERIAAARSLLSYALDRAIADPDGASGPRARTQGFARAALLLAKVGDAEEAATLSREAAAKLGVDPTQLWIEAQKLGAALSRPVRSAAPPREPAATATTRERDLVSLLLASPDARGALLPIIEDADVRHEALRAIVVGLMRRPEAPPEAVMSELADDGARNMLAALLVVERAPDDPATLIEQFRTHLLREQRLRRQRAASQSIADAQARTDAPIAVEEQFRILHDASKVVYEITGGVAQSLQHGPSGSPRAE